MTIPNIVQEIERVLGGADGVSSVEVSMTVKVVLHSEPGVNTSSLESQVRGFFPKGVHLVFEDKR